MAINNETYFEFDGILDVGFTTVPNTILNDKRLSFKSIGVYVQILQYRNTGSHKVYLKSLSNYRSDKKTAVSSALKELETCGYISKEYIRNERGQMQGMKYIVRINPIDKPIENTTNEPNSEKLTSDNPTSDNTLLKRKYIKKENVVKKENKDDDEAKLIALYKSFKLEKRIMPHTTKLLKANKHISLEVFEQIFINATSKDNIYRYLQEVIKDLNNNKITSLADFTKHIESRKNSNKRNKSPKKKTTAHNINQTFEKYNSDELEKMLLENQKGKFQ